MQLLFYMGVGKLRNAGGKMWNDECGKYVIGQFKDHVSTPILQNTTPPDLHFFTKLWNPSRVNDDHQKQVKCLLFSAENKLESIGYSALPLPPRLMQRAVNT